jgi:hypothetical protein
MVLSSLISVSAASASRTSLLLSSRNFFSFTRQDSRSLSYILSLADCSFNTFFNAVANWLDFSFSAVTASNAFSASYKPHPKLIKHTSKVIFETDPTSFQLPITFSMPRSRSTMNV